MREVAICDLSIAAGLHVVAASFNEGDLVVPPHDVAPVWLVVFLKLSVELQVLSDLHDDVLGRHTWIGRVFALVPLALTEVEGTHGQSHIDDGSLFSSTVLELDASELGILVARHQEDATLGKLFKQVAWREAIFAIQVGQSRLVTIY